MDDPTERWLPITGYVGLYEVSDIGRVRSVLRTITRSDGKVKTFQGKILKPWINASGYAVVYLSRRGSQEPHLVHRLVLAAFTGACPEGQEGRHGPNGKLDNRASQLCYGTRRENMADKIRDGSSNRGERHGLAKLTADGVLDIRRRRADGERLEAIARRHGVSFQNVSLIVNRKAWSHI
jgi:hypothetical protein